MYYSLIVLCIDTFCVCACVTACLVRVYEKRVLSVETRTIRRARSDPARWRQAIAATFTVTSP